MVEKDMARLACPCNHMYLEVEFILFTCLACLFGICYRLSKNAEKQDICKFFHNNEVKPGNVILNSSITKLHRNQTAIIRFVCHLLTLK